MQIKGKFDESNIKSCQAKCGKSTGGDFATDAGLAAGEIDGQLFRIHKATIITGITASVP